MRAAGLLMHISSLPSPYGVGTMGAAAREFVDFLAASGQRYWQVLPVGPTGYGDSPYQSYSTFAGTPYFSDLEELTRAGLLQPQEYDALDWGDDPARVDYGLLHRTRFPVLRLAAGRLLADPPADYALFCQKKAWWLDDYALFMALKDAHGGAALRQWDDALRRREPQALAQARQKYAADVDFWKAVQYLFFQQWTALKAYANEKGILLIGDCPIYVSPDSADLWANPELFQLDDDGTPTRIAGCPPDGFFATGQLWGNPLFDWDAVQRQGYRWWIARIGYLCQVFDVLRIDHFRGFDAYYAIPYGAPDASGGAWRTGPGKALFQAVEASIGRQNIIAEDLGFLTPSVYQLLEDCGFPGMKVLQFAFDSRDPSSASYLPHVYTPHCVAYVGTHDNDTAAGWMHTAHPEDVAHATAYLHLTQEEGYHWGMLRGLWSSVADTAIAQVQDLLGLGSEARMNTPATLGDNWRWRLLPGQLDEALSRRLREAMALYGRQAPCEMTP